MPWSIVLKLLIKFLLSRAETVPLGLALTAARSRIETLLPSGPLAAAAPQELKDLLTEKLNAAANNIGNVFIKMLVKQLVAILASSGIDAIWDAIFGSTPLMASSSDPLVVAAMSDLS